MAREGYGDVPARRRSPHLDGCRTRRHVPRAACSVPRTGDVPGVREVAATQHQRNTAGDERRAEEGAEADQLQGVGIHSAFGQY